ncbi:multicopper oxidase family protein [Marinobacter sp. LQ44]|uniref:multicopper oxidase family protein n=1 Tax=unclassified Marinobacter TaxID=83889 RepID=UPI000718E73A|nr:copper oxidase [Marinobacter sp. LQ44]AMQ88289.1 copper oxidase [Marinobacter sp. LQ44]
MVNRRHFILGSAAGLVAGALPAQAFAAGNRHDTTHTPLTAPDRTSQGYRPVITPNGRTLGYRLRDGVKEFHLIAEEIEHAFGDGTTIKAWGYNGSTPGPTLEAVEGDRVRIYVTNRLKEPTSVHWHGLILPNGMDGVSGLTQPSIPPGKTFVYEFPLVQHGTHMYHPHADEMVQMAMGMMGMFIIHPREPEANPVDRDYAIMLHNWSVHPGTYRPDPSIMQDFDLWTMNSKVFPFIDSLVAQTGERVRIRMGNLSMWNHPMHVHGVKFWVTGGDGGRWPQAQWRTEATEIVGVGQARDIEFIATPGDWAFHCHMAHHTMNAMGHDIPNTLGVNQNEVEQRIQALVPGYMAMGEHGMGEHQTHVDAGHMPGPENTLAMMMGKGQFGNMEMGGMFTVIKVRDQLDGDPGWYQHPTGTVARETDRVPNDLPK